MDRRAWLDDRLAAVLADYDADAPSYDQVEYPVEAQRRFVDRLLETCPPGGIVLDAPCGTGLYFAQVAASGRRVTGIDGSAGMLAEAHAKGIAVGLEKLALQELPFEHEFDAVMTIDAMENVGPEDWPSVLANLRRAARPGATLYLTVEEIEDEAGIEEAYEDLRRRGLPAVRGEVVEGETAGYHFYPGRDRVLAWFAAAGLQVVVEEYVHARDGWGYRHFLLRTPAAG